MKQINMLVLAGGFGARLSSVVSDVPKPLAPVMDRPYLHYLIESWVAQGVTSLTFLLHHKAELIRAFLKLQQSEGRLMGCKVDALTEPQPLGTGGAVAYAVQQLRLAGTFLVANADTWLGSGVTQVSAADAPAIALVQVENSERYGSVQFRNNRVIAFEEKQSSARSGWINAGLYHLRADLFHGWDGQPFSLERELFPKLVASDGLNAVPLDTDFIDIGIPEDYFRFCRWIETKRTGVLRA